jgi:hypothetical protein
MESPTLLATDNGPGDKKMNAYNAVSILTAVFLFGHFFLHSDSLGVAMGLGAMVVYAIVSGRN